MGQVFDLRLEEPSSTENVPLEQVALRLHPADNVAIVKTNLHPGTTLVLDSDADGQSQVPVRQLIPSGHKIALSEIPLGEPIYRYGCVIGYAATAIRTLMEEGPRARYVMHAPTGEYVPEDGMRGLMDCFSV